MWLSSLLQWCMVASSRQGWCTVTEPQMKSFPCSWLVLFIRGRSLKSFSHLLDVYRERSSDYIILFKCDLSLLAPDSAHCRYDGDVPARGVTRPQQQWLSASCPPAAALQSSGGQSTRGALPAPPAPRKSAPLSSLACTAPGNRRRLMMAIITRHQMPTSQTMTRSTARRRTNSRRRRREVRNGPVTWPWMFIVDLGDSTVFKFSSNRSKLYFCLLCILMLSFSKLHCFYSHIKAKWRLLRKALNTVLWFYSQWQPLWDLV